MMRSDCNFTDRHFPYVFENYQGGQSIFNYMESLYKVDGVKSFLQVLYDNGISVSLRKNFSITVQQFESGWKNNLDNFKK